MMDDRTDEQLDQWIHEAAQSYHEPPNVPREAMWRAIQDRRHAPRPVAYRPGRWITWSMAAAAAIAVLAIGIAIGRGLPTATQPEVAATTGEGAATGKAGEVSTALAIATAEHLAQTETFLSLFRDAARSGGASGQASGTARHLLANNRLIADTPVATDPTLRALLEDLELVLAQIAQLSDDSWEGETDLITDGLEQRAVLTRLQGLVPAGSPRTARSL